jgi:Tfp pilus assembly protein PilF
VEVVEAGALALASAGRPQDALGLLAQARARDPGSALLAVHTGTVYVMAGDRERARHEFEEALAINPAIARAHSSLAVIDAEQGRTDAALADWRRAIELDPREIEKLFAFGEFLRRSGRSAAARPYLELFVALAPPDRFGLERQRARQWLERTR